jgi:phenylacetate-coenzyme A ligase PaaK-like adenylate-forming protein
VTVASQEERPATLQLRDELVRQTIAWCVSQSRFYRERFEAAPSFRGLADLPTLPVLHREDVVEHHADLMCDQSLPAGVQHTTGTTGASLQLHRSATEQAFIWDFFSAQLAARPLPTPRPLHLNLVNAYHGSLTPMPTAAFVLNAGVFDRAQASQARVLLDRTYSLEGVERRVSVVIGTERMVKALTVYLSEDGFDLAASPVRTIALFGGHVTPNRKRLLSRLWQAAVKDNYSLTEVFGGASECGIGGPWIFDPHVVAEVVHPRTFEPVVEGVGVLLLTTLYPFVQQMPLVRYCTNDLVEVVETGEQDGAPVVRYAGRVPRSILDARGSDVEPLLLSGRLYEILESYPDIAVSPRFPDLCDGPGLELTGDHHFGVDHRHDEGVDRITIRLGLRYAPQLFPEHVAAIDADIRARVSRAHPALARRLSVGDAELEVVALPADAVAPYDSK